MANATTAEHQENAKAPGIASEKDNVTEKDREKAIAAGKVSNTRMGAAIKAVLPPLNRKNNQRHNLKSKYATHTAAYFGFCCYDEKG